MIGHLAAMREIGHRFDDLTEQVLGKESGILVARNQMPLIKRHTVP